MEKKRISETISSKDYGTAHTVAQAILNGKSVYLVDTATKKGE